MRVAGLGVLGPLRGGAGLVQREVDLQRLRAPRRGGAACSRAWSGRPSGPDRAFGAGMVGRVRRAGGRVGKEQLGVVVEARAVKPSSSSPVSTTRDEGAA